MAKKNDYTAKSYTSTLKKPAITSGIMAETLDEHLRKEKPGDFKYTPKKPTWSYSDKALRGVYDQIMNRKDFSTGSHTAVIVMYGPFSAAMV